MLRSKLILLMLLTGCAAPVLKEDFDDMGYATFDMDYELCEKMAEDMKSRFGWSQIPKTQCMYQKGYRLKPKGAL